MIWVYGICDKPDLPAPQGPGLADAPLESLREGELLAVFTRHTDPVGDPAPEALWAHERVVERLMDDRAVLPMRFGSRLEDEDALRRLLAERRLPLLAALARVAGRVELGVRAIERDSAPVATTVATGRDYLLAKLRVGGLADELHEPLAELADEARRHPPRGAGELLRAAYLVDRSATARFRATVERLQARRDDVALLCTGPWPPYSFVGEASPEPVAAR
jgi:Gas vesicle synthesis protein GvpL/GvpF